MFRRSKESKLGEAAYKGNLRLVRELLAKGVNVNAKGGTVNGSALHEAAYKGHLEVVQCLIASGADVNAKNEGGSTALCLAALDGHFEVMQCLIKHGAAVDEKVCRLISLREAARHGLLEVVQCLIANGAAVNEENNVWWGDDTALHEAAKKGHLEVVQSLIANGAAMNEKNKDGDTALHEAAKYGHLEVVLCLIADGAEVNEKNNMGKTAYDLATKQILKEYLKNVSLDPTENKENELREAATEGDLTLGFNLREAAYKGNLALVRELLAKGAEVNEKETTAGWTALHKAAVKGHLKVVQCLIASGADLHAKNEDGLTALRLAALEHHLEVVQCLIKNGAVDEKACLYICLRDAAMHGLLEVVQWKIANGAAMNEKNEDGDTALHEAAKEGHLEIVQCLIANGAAVNEKNEYDQPALHYAAFFGHLEVVQCLIANGAAVNEKNRKGETAFDLATKPKVKEYLKNVSLNLTENRARPSAESSSKSLAKPLSPSSPLPPRPTALSKPAPTPARLPTVLPINKPSPVKAAPTLRAQQASVENILSPLPSSYQDTEERSLPPLPTILPKPAPHPSGLPTILPPIPVASTSSTSRIATALPAKPRPIISPQPARPQPRFPTFVSTSYQDTEERPLPALSTFLPEPAPHPSGLPTILPPIPVASTSSTSRIATALPAKPRPIISSQPTPPQPQLPTVFPVSKSSPTILTPTPEALIASPSSARRESLLVNNEGSMQMNIGIPYEKLEFKKNLGSGSYGAVLRGKYGVSKVAIKCLHDQTPQVLEAFKQEISLMMSLNSEYIVRTIGGCFEPGHYAIVMEYGKKGALGQLLREPETCSEADAIKIADWGVRYQMALDIACGMAYLHSRMPTVIHADLKSDNVIIDQYYRAKLSDFGCSKLKTSTSSKATLLGPKWAGTSPWMAPEVLDGESTTPASDSYSFGVTLWELGARKIPLAGKKDSQIINLVVNQDQREPVSVDTPPKMTHLIRWCWSKQPEARPTLSQAVEILTEEYKEQFKKKK